MCWSLEISLLAALWGYSVCGFLCYRQYSPRDRWYALFLASFTTTQLFDAYYWALESGSGEIPCTRGNYLTSKFLLPPVVFLQPAVLSVFPSDAFVRLRRCYRVLTVLGCLVPVAYKGFGCTTLWEDGEGDEILWGGYYPPAWVVIAGIALWSFGAMAFVRPWKAWRDILLVGGVVLTLLMKLDGSFRLISKMCTYCLLLSIVWLLEPLWMPPGGSRSRAGSPGASTASPGGAEMVVLGVPVTKTGSIGAATPVQQVGRPLILYRPVPLF